MLRAASVIMLLICVAFASRAQIAANYYCILSETESVISSNPNPHFSAQVDSLKQLQPSDKNIEVAAMVVFNVCSDLYGKSMHYKLINYVSYCRPILENTLPNTQEAQSTYVDILNHCGMAYGALGLNPQSLDLFEKALGIAEKYDMTDKLAVLYNNVGSVYLNSSQYEICDSIYLKAVKINEQTKNTGRLFINYNNLSVSAAQRGNYNKALEYAFLSMHQLDESKHKNRIMILRRNIAGIYLKNNEKSVALRNLWEVKAYQEEQQQWRNLASTYYTISTAYKDASDSFAIYLLKAEQAARLAGTVIDNANILLELGEYYSAKGLHSRAAAYFREYATCKDSILASEMEIHASGLSSVYAEEDARVARIERLERNLQQKRSTIVVISAIAIGIFIAAIFIAIIWWRKRKIEYFHKAQMKVKAQLKRINELKTDVENLETQLRNQDDTLDINEKKRTILALQSVRVHEFIDSLTSRLKRLLLKLNTRDTETRKALREVLHDIDQMDNDASLREFVSSFENINEEFYRKLSEQFPSLTARELRMCALVKLGLSSKEIADITFREVRSVEAVRNRLRKKLSLDQSENLSEFLKRF